MNTHDRKYYLEKAMKANTDLQKARDNCDGCGWESLQNATNGIVDCTQGKNDLLPEDLYEFNSANNFNKEKFDKLPIIDRAIVYWAVRAIIMMNRITISIDMMAGDYNFARDDSRDDQIRTTQFERDIGSYDKCPYQVDN